MSKTKHIILALLAVTGISTAVWADNNGPKTAYPVQWTGATTVTYTAQPQNGLSASYVDGNNVTHALVLTFTNGTEVITAPNYPVNVGSWTVTATSPQTSDQLEGATTFLNIQPALVSVTGAAAEIAKFADGTLDGVVTEQGTLNGVLGNDNVGHLTTAIFSSGNVGTGATITLHYALVGDTTLVHNYYMSPASQVYTNSGVIIPNILPNMNYQGGEGINTQNGIDLSAYGYCNGTGYSIDYHLSSGNPDQYRIDFVDPALTDVAWSDLSTAGANGTFDVNLPADLATGDYAMNLIFRDSRFTALESNPITVNIHVNLPETYTMPLFNNVIALVDTCHCFTDIQWYHRANAGDAWAAIPGANGYYYREEGGLTGEYFVSARMNGVMTFTCPQTDMATLIADEEQPANVKAYPNPTTESVSVTISGSNNATHVLHVVNTVGIEMESRTFEGETTTIDMQSYPRGNYMVSVDGMVVRVIRN